MQPISEPAQPMIDSASASIEYPVRFLGTGSEYFRIWIVNLLLTIVTLGIYSAWAKVRRLKYMYRNTQIAEASSDYHGSPLAILKGRLIALVLLIAYNFSFRFSVAAGVITLVLLAAVFPWLIRQSLRFRLRYSSYRGIRFRFNGSVGELYLIAAPILLLVLPGVLAGSFAGADEDALPPTWFVPAFFGSLLIYFALVPYLHYRFKRYQHGNSFLGSTAVTFSATARGFYAVYGILFSLTLGIGLVAVAAGAAVGYGVWLSTGEPPVVGIVIGLVLFYALYLLIWSAFVVLLQNRVWNNTAVGEVHFLEARRRYCRWRAFTWSTSS